jgi:hypothetical protein
MAVWQATLENDGLFAVTAYDDENGSCKLASKDRIIDDPTPTILRGFSPPTEF